MLDFTPCRSYQTTITTTAINHISHHKSKEAAVYVIYMICVVSSCKQLTKTCRLKRPAIEYLSTVVYCLSRENFAVSLTQLRASAATVFAT